MAVPSLKHLTHIITLKVAMKRDLYKLNFPVRAITCHLKDESTFWSLKTHVMLTHPEGTPETFYTILDFFELML